ncbi:MAG: hypothetical protein ACIALR_08750 [Blastopirellula sp. JB062]
MPFESFPFSSYALQTSNVRRMRIFRRLPLAGAMILALLTAGWAAAASPDETGPALEFYSLAKGESFQLGTQLFSDRSYVLKTLPERLQGMTFVQTNINGYDLECTRAGVLYAITPTADRQGAASQEKYLASEAFEKLETDEFQLFGRNLIDRVSVYRKEIAEGERLSIRKWVVLVAPRGLEISQAQPTPWSENEGELLYNGIRLPRVWPPTQIDTYGQAPLPVPYLDAPPKRIVIDTGRQLFVDDFLIEESTLSRTWHKARKYEGNPVMTPQTDLELGVESGNAPMAAPFSGGVWYDPADKLFKMWYCAGWFDGTAYATSVDGVAWQRPQLDVVAGTNRIVPRKGVRDSAAVILDQTAEDPNKRYQMLIWSRPQGGEIFSSADGVQWSEPTPTGPMGDRSTIFYNPFRKKWVYSIRASWSRRSRNYSESDDLTAGAAVARQVPWMRADNQDLPDEHWFYAFPQRRRKPTTPALYNLDAVAYESLMLGALAIYQGPDNKACAAEGVPKLTEIHLGFSRDGFHWHRPDDRTPLIAAARREGAWDRGYLHSNAAVCLIMGDELWFYYTGFAGDPKRKGLSIAANGMYANASLGVAKLRRDGFASMDAGEEGGALTTRPVVFQGDRLFVNVDCPQGSLRVDVLDQAGEVVPGYSAERCRPISTDRTLTEVTWEGMADLADLAGKPIRFRFHLQNGALYAFWVSPEKTGASYGYAAGGGLGIPGPIDTVGNSADVKASLADD